MKLYLRIALGLIGFVIIALVGIAAYVKLTFGNGSPYPDISTTPLVPTDDLEVVAELPLPPANVAVSADGRIFFNYHFLGVEDDGAGNSVFELVDGQPVPYPSEELQSEFNTTLGMYIDAQGLLWIVDMAGQDETRNTRLFAIDPASDEIVYDYTFPTDDADFAQDMQLTSNGQHMILANTGLFGVRPASLIVLDTNSGETWTVLEGHESVEPQDWHIRTGEGERVSVFFGFVDWSVGVDGITLSDDDEWLYYGAINHDTLYRIPTRILLQDDLTTEQVISNIEAVGQKPLSDGFSIDQEGNVYVTDIENGGIGRMSVNRSYETLIKSPDVRWADGISFGPDNFVYFTDSAIPAYLTNTAEPLTVEEHEAFAPYFIYRFQNDIAGTPGS